jgi:hypothetical protein
MQQDAELLRLARHERHVLADELDAHVVAAGHFGRFARRRRRCIRKIRQRHTEREARAASSDRRHREIAVAVCAELSELEVSNP